MEKEMAHLQTQTSEKSSKRGGAEVAEQIAEFLAVSLLLFWGLAANLQQKIPATPSAGSAPLRFVESRPQRPQQFAKSLSGIQSQCLDISMPSSGSLMLDAK